MSTVWSGLTISLYHSCINFLLRNRIWIDPVLEYRMLVPVRLMRLVLTPTILSVLLRAHVLPMVMISIYHNDSQYTSGRPSRQSVASRSESPK